MSQADVERFVGDLKSDSGLLEGLKSEASGISSVVNFAKSKGYDISVDEAKSYITERSKQDLNDDQLDAIAGGKGGSKCTTTEVAVAAQVAETCQAATSVEAAAEVAVAAVAAIVLT